MPRPLHLLTYPTPSQKSRAHWSLYIPSLTSPLTGKIIHAVGTPFTGYGLVFKRNYSLDTEERKYDIHLLCEVADEHVVDTPGDGKLSEDVEPRDRLEQEAKRVEVPGVSPRPLDPFAGNGCQWWLRQYVEWLVQRKIVGQEAVDVLDRAPIV